MASASNAPASQAGQTWHHAMKLRKHLLKQLEKVQSEGGIDHAQFEKIDSLLQSLRLSCVQTIFLDFEYAVAEKTESVLWTLHTSVNSEYRRALGKLKGNAHVVEKRKVDKMYQNFLRVAQQFYKGYVQRIAARYDIQELKRIANGLEVEQDGAGDMISPVPEKLSRLVLLSCHSTLIRLGDLARYRVQAKYKKFGGFESALTFYSLANDLVPESGFGHHQMGIIELEEGNHLEVVYRFYRAWAAAEPHPNAKSNLESKLRDLRASNTPSPRQVSATPRDTFSMWFVRLHALFYKGEPFSQHAELEGEVIHRLDMMAKNPEARDVLLKTILINIASFHVASSKHAESKKESDLQFVRFTMALNARFATAICNVLGAELEKHAHERRSDVGSFQNDELPPVLAHLLPMLRVYMTWFASQRSAIFSSPEAAGGLVSAMLQSLARVLTLLCAEATEHKGLASYPFLLWEDLETRGLQPLGFDQVPEACRCYCDENGAIKPRQEPQATDAEVHKQGLARLLDVLRAGYFLAEDSTAPLVHRIVDDALLFESTVHQPGFKMNAVETKAYPTEHAESAATNRLIQSEPGLLESHEASPNCPGPQPKDTTWSDFSNGDDATNDRTENTVMSMLTPFLKPPTPQLAGHNSTALETSYGLHSATAEDVFGSIVAQRSPGGTIQPTTFEQLPWGWLHTPTPSKGNRDSRESFSEHSKLLSDPSGVMSPNLLQHDHLQSPLAGRAPSAVSYGRPPVPLRSPFAPAADDAHRTQLLQSFSGVGSAPRTSSFSHWSPEHISMRSRQTEPSPWSAGAANAPNSVPLSSNMSAFSHPSSLYQGTPLDNVPASNPTVNSAGRGPSSSNSWQSSRPGDRQRQVNNATSSYDAAIFDAAFRD